VARPQRDSIFTRPSARGYPWCRASSQPQKVRFAPDSALEEDGFELPVPIESSLGVPTECASRTLSKGLLGANPTHRPVWDQIRARFAVSGGHAEFVNTNQSISSVTASFGLILAR
jgi:hypothetical protein